MTERKQLKTGVRKKGGPPPGYLWDVALIDFVVNEAMHEVGIVGYQHLAKQVRILAGEKDPGHSIFVDVDQIEDFYEICELGGPFGKANVRLFFHLDSKKKCIVPLGAIKKQNSNQTPHSDVVRMRVRCRRYIAGEYGSLPVLE